MKHTLQVTLMLLTFFLAAQYIGLNVLYSSIDKQQSDIQGQTIFEDLPVGERPPLEEQTSYAPILGSIIIGTILLLILIKLNWTWVWKIWFLIAVGIALTMSLGTYLPASIAVAVAFILAAWRVFKPNFWLQNLTEVFIYGGLAVIFVPILNLWSVSILIILIAIYDAYAVWKSKHMVTLATSQTKANIFAGLYIPYKIKKDSTPTKTASATAASATTSTKKSPSKTRTALLGGGDIGFPLIFAGVIMKELGLWQSLIIPLFAAAGLALLLWKGDHHKFYPAMPFIGGACFLGWGVVWVVSLIL